MIKVKTLKQISNYKFLGALLICVLSTGFCLQIVYKIEFCCSFILEPFAIVAFLYWFSTLAEHQTHMGRINTLTHKTDAQYELNQNP